MRRFFFFRSAPLGFVAVAVAVVAACGGNVVVDPAGRGGAASASSSSSFSSSGSLTSAAGGSIASSGFAIVASSTGPGTGGALNVTVATVATASSSSTSSSGCSSSLPTCLAACVTQHPAAYQRFLTYELKFCGCDRASPCGATCSVSCGATEVPSCTPCAECLEAQISLAQASPCTANAALGPCNSDPQCAEFVSCGIACGGG